MNEKKKTLRETVEAFFSCQKNAPTTVHDRANGRKPRAEANEDHQTPSKY